MSGLQRDWLAGTTLEKPQVQQSSKRRQASFAEGAASDDLYDKIAALAEHLEREIDARKAVEADLAKQKVLQAKLTSSFAALQTETEARVAVERDARLGLGEPNCRRASGYMHAARLILRCWIRCTGIFAVAEHEMKLLTAGDGTRSSVRDVKREVAAVRGEVEGLADTLAELRSEMATMRNQLNERHEVLREKLLAEIQAELRQGRGGLRQVVDRMVMGMDIQVDLDAVRTAAQEWNTSFQAKTEARVHAAMEAAQAILTNHAMVAVADAHALQGGASNSPIARQSLRGIDSRLGKIEKQWNEERRVILRKLQSLDAARQDTVAASANAATETAAATAAAVARAVVKETVPQEGVPLRASIQEGRTEGTSIVPTAVSTRLDSLEATVSAIRRDNGDIQSYMEGLSTQTRGFILLQKLMLRK
eukprot:COSAG02_NODE_281_length_25776_cov_37.797998_9_plen_422_part_00